MIPGTRHPRFNEFSDVPNQRSVGAKLHLAATRNTSPGYAEGTQPVATPFRSENPAESHGSSMLDDYLRRQTSRKSLLSQSFESLRLAEVARSCHGGDRTKQESQC